ncbi:unnamed protein product [Chilo suppressalis]|uniref:SCP domain-containing protein n=1 Tax=Chilo suppressalis TaxID=168631 RepID=A0ABN8L7H2_CHISP|nr:unnamed protein product [Chilo suppressalis]
MHLPKPELMMMVEWDRELASLAQRLADQCNFVHDQCRATVRYPYAGQTVGEVRWRRSSGSDAQTAQRAIRRVLDAWWGERRRVQPEQLTAPFRLTAKGAVWGHFSQLAVWSLRAVGCGAVRHGAHFPRLLLVCDFSHTNMLGQRTISPGPLARCPSHTERRLRSSYPLLCASVRYPPPERNYGVESEDYSTDDENVEELSLPRTSPHYYNTTHAVAENTVKYLTTTRTTVRSVDRWRNIAFQGATQSQAKGALMYKLSRELGDRKKADNKVMLFVDDANWRSRVMADEKQLAFKKRILNINDEIEESTEKNKEGRGTARASSSSNTLAYRRYSNITELVSSTYFTPVPLARSIMKQQYEEFE